MNPYIIHSVRLINQICKSNGGALIMIMFRVECKPTYHWDDYSSTHFEVFASNLNGAWKRVLELEDRSNIIRIYPVRIIQ